MDAAAKRQQLRNLLNQPGLIVAPGSYDALMARLIEMNDFPLTHITGGGISRSLGYPDVGLLTMTEVVERCGFIARSIDIPVIADADAGYGNVVNVRRAVEEFERAGIAAIHIEDEVEPKKCNLLVNAGHRIELIPIAEMVGKIQAAIATRTDPNFLIVPRICAKGSEDFDDVLRRAHAYARAGADVLFLIHLSAAQLERACKEVPVPILYNVTFHGSWVKTFPSMSVDFKVLEQMGLKIAVLSSAVALGGLLGMNRALKAIKQDGSIYPYFGAQEGLEEMESFYMLRGANEVQEWENRFLPESGTKG
jgi:2-methylisocitrate lyase-like PEP mutase family enzyme